MIILDIPFGLHVDGPIITGGAVSGGGGGYEQQFIVFPQQ